MRKLTYSVVYGRCHKYNQTLMSRLPLPDETVNFEVVPFIFEAHWRRLHDVHGCFHADDVFVGRMETDAPWV